jgi:ATP-dependent Clp protease ATP-binding subunit ClpA
MNLHPQLEALFMSAAKQAADLKATSFGLPQLMILYLEAGKEGPLFEFLKNEEHAERLLEHFRATAQAISEHQAEAELAGTAELEAWPPFNPPPDEAVRGLLTSWEEERGDEALDPNVFLRLLLLNWDNFYPLSLEKLGIEIDTEDEGAASFLSALFAPEFDLGKRYSTPMQGLLKHVEYTRSMMEVLVRRYRQNLLLYGPPGSGKSTVLRRLITDTQADAVPKIFRNRRFFEFNHEVFLKDVKDSSELGMRFDLLREHLESHPDLILVFESVQFYFRSENPLMLDFVQRLLRLLEFKRVHFVLIADLDFYNLIFKTHPRFEEVMSPLYIAPLSRGEVVQILMQVKDRFEEQYEEELSEEKLTSLVEMADEHIRKMHFPKKALILLDVTLSIRALSADDSMTWDEALNTALCRITGTKDVQFPELKARLGQLESDLQKAVIGQNVAVAEVCRTIRFMKSDLDLNPDRPDGVFLLAGPSGVGKQLFAKELSMHLFARPPLMVDLSAYQEAESLVSLLQAPEGSSEPSVLTQLREEPHRVLVLKNIEYAAPEVLMYFLHGFEEGHLRDASGLHIPVGGLTVLLLSDLLGHESKSGIGFLEESADKSEMKASDLKDYFSSDLLNSLDKLVVFQNLNEDALKSILHNRMVPQFCEKVQHLGHSLHISEDVENHVAREGAEQACNARNVDRKFEDLVAERVNEEILNAGSERLDIQVQLDGEVISLTSKAIKA